MNREKFGFKAKPKEIRQEIEAGAIEYEEIKQIDKKKTESYQADKERREKEPIIQLRNTIDIKNEVDAEDVYNWYADAISRREREPLTPESFNYHFFEGGSFENTFAYGDKEKGYLLGFNKFNIFTPTHFAPKTLRGGYELLLKLGESQTTPAVLAITEDLAETLDKMPSWQKLELSEEIMSYFRGEIVKKDIYFNSHPRVKDLMIGLLLEYMNKQSSHDENNEGDDWEEEVEELEGDEINDFEDVS